MADILIKSAIAVILPVIAVGLIDKYEKNSSKSDVIKISPKVLYGVLFGALAIICSKLGITIGKSYVDNTDAVIVIAGTFISGLSGVIAGIVVAAVKLISVSTKMTSITLIADCIAAILAGGLAAFSRKIMFDDKRPNWIMALFNGLIVEILHLMLIFSTNMNRPDKVVGIIQRITVPMIFINALSLLAVSFALYLRTPNLKGIFSIRRAESKSIFETIQIWLLNVIILAFLAVSIFMILFETNLATSQINEEFTIAMEEVTQDVTDASDRYQINLTKMIVSDIEEGDHNLSGLVEWYGVSEINIIDKNGIIVESSNPVFLDFDMRSGVQSAEFLRMFDNLSEYAQPYMKISADSNTYMKYAGVKYDGGIVQMGYNAESFQKTLNKELRDVLKNRHVGNTGFFIVFDENKNTIATSSNFSHYYKFAANQIDFKSLVPNKVMKMYVNGDQYYCIYNETEGYDLMAFCTVEEAMTTGAISIYIAIFNMILVFSILFVLIYILIKKLVVNQIISMAGSLARITDGDLNEVVNVRSNAEFASLSDDINSTVDTLKRYIDEAASRIDKELEFAKAIQLSAMPNHFPAFPSRKDIDIYARMDTAKEVGGDFYDFYFTGEDIFNFMIADVSGKGIPAAMFMMRAKSVLRGQTIYGHEINEVFSESNDMLCADNEANMFVTAWQGQINLKTGLVSIANAGHNPAIIKRKDGQFEYLKLKPNLVLASMDGIPYRKHEVQLNPGDTVYLYTDGVTEATNLNDELYGEDRLINLLNDRMPIDVKEICDAVKADVDLFVGEAPQFDDITMVAFKFIGD